MALIIVNTWIEVNVIFSLFGNVLNLLGFIATSWALPTQEDVQIEYEGLGLWRFCLREPGSNPDESNPLECLDMINESGVPGWFRGIQSLICIAFICSILSFITIIFYACAQICQQNRKMLIFSIVNNYIAVLLQLIGVIWFGLVIGETTTILGVTGFKLSWCFIISTFSTVIFMFNGGLVIFELLTVRTIPYREDKMSDFSSGSHADSTQAEASGGLANLGGIDLTMEDPGIKSISKNGYDAFA